LPQGVSTVHDWDEWPWPVVRPGSSEYTAEMAFWMYSSGSRAGEGVDTCTCDLCVQLWQAGPRHPEDDIVFSPPKIFFAYGFGNSITFPSAPAPRPSSTPGADPIVLSVIGGTGHSSLRTADALARSWRIPAEARPFQPASCLSAAGSFASSSTVAQALWTFDRGREGVPKSHIYLSNRVDRQKLGASRARVPGEIRLCDMEKDVRREVRCHGSTASHQAPFIGAARIRRARRCAGWIWTGDRFLRAKWLHL
jgi:acetyl-CoA synthetase